jgi:selenocysteine lyase/cysteine desulfurase
LYWVYKLKERVGVHYITLRERQLLKLARKRLGSIPNLIFLGQGIYNDPYNDGEIINLPIISFLVRAPEELGGYLHHNFVCSLLNDLVNKLSKVN